MWFKVEFSYFKLRVETNGDAVKCMWIFQRKATNQGGGVSPSLNGLDQSELWISENRVLWESILCVLAAWQDGPKTRGPCSKQVNFTLTCYPHGLYSVHVFSPNNSINQERRERVWVVVASNNNKWGIIGSSFQLVVSRYCHAVCRRQGSQA